MIEIFLGLAVLVLVFYILFKILKTVVKAVLVFVIILLVIITGFMTMIYLDYSYYSHSLTNFNLDVYVKGNDYIGVSLPIRNHSVDMEGIQDAPAIKDLKDLPVKGHISLIIPEAIYKELLVGPVKLNDDGVMVVNGVSINVTLSKDEFFEVLDSSEPKKTLVSVLVKKNSNLEKWSKYGLDLNKMFGDEVDKFLEGKNVGVKGVLVLISFRDILSDKSSVAKLINYYKDGQVILVPERPSLKILKKVIPTDKILEYIEGSS